MMLPPSVFAPQAGASNTGAANAPKTAQVDLRNGAAAAALPASLVPQAGIARQRSDSMDARDTRASGHYR